MFHKGRNFRYLSKIPDYAKRGNSLNSIDYAADVHLKREPINGKQIN